MWQDVDPWLALKQRPCVVEEAKKINKAAKAVAKKATKLAAARRQQAKPQKTLIDHWGSV